ncbi:MAG: MoaD/ThiS family protein [Candidatus Tectomicrobia bacterium]|nr:MoaD/ThiS family protein [Candidatus Tectomicrobia bacterium]
MTVQVLIPTPLQKITKNQAEVPASGTSIKEVLADMESNYPGLRQRLYDENGQLRRFVNIYVNEEDIRFLNGEQTTVKDGDKVSIVPAIAGGSR